MLNFDRAGNGTIDFGSSHKHCSPTRPNSKQVGAREQMLSHATLMLEMSEEPIAEKKVGDTLEHMGGSKTVGSNAIHPAVVKPSVEILLKPFNQAVSASLDDGRLSAEWFPSTVILVHK